MQLIKQNALFIVAGRQHQALFQVLSYCHKAFILTMLVQFRCSQTMMHKNSSGQACKLIQAQCKQPARAGRTNAFTMSSFFKEKGETGRQRPGVTQQGARAAERTCARSLSFSPFVLLSCSVRPSAYTICRLKSRWGCGSRAQKGHAGDLTTHTQRLPRAYLMVVPRQTKFGNLLVYFTLLNICQISINEERINNYHTNAEPQVGLLSLCLTSNQAFQSGLAWSPTNSRYQ